MTSYSHEHGIRVSEETVRTRLPQKGRKKQKIRDKFSQIQLDNGVDVDDEELEEFVIPEKINRRR